MDPSEFILHTVAAANTDNKPSNKKSYIDSSTSPPRPRQRRTTTTNSSFIRQHQQESSSDDDDDVNNNTSSDYEDTDEDEESSAAAAAPVASANSFNRSKSMQATTAGPVPIPYGRQLSQQTPQQRAKKKRLYSARTEPTAASVPPPLSSQNSLKSSFLRIINGMSPSEKPTRPKRLSFNDDGRFSSEDEQQQPSSLRNMNEHTSTNAAAAAPVLVKYPAATTAAANQRVPRGVHSFSAHRMLSGHVPKMGSSATVSKCELISMSDLSSGQQNKPPQQQHHHNSHVRMRHHSFTNSYRHHHHHHQHTHQDDVEEEEQQSLLHHGGGSTSTSASLDNHHQHSTVAKVPADTTVVLAMPQQQASSSKDSGIDSNNNTDPMSNNKKRISTTTTATSSGDERVIQFNDDDDEGDVYKPSHHQPQQRRHRGGLVGGFLKMCKNKRFYHRNGSGGTGGSYKRRSLAVTPSATGSFTTQNNNKLATTSAAKKPKLRDIEHRRRAYLAIAVLFVVNLLNYIDRYTIAGVLPQIQEYFDINDSKAGLLQTVFICSYMLLAPLFGYLGDRYNRKWLVIFGITFWSAMTLAGSFIPKTQFWTFAIIRSLVGIGEASYSCVAPTIIGDLFTDELRTKMLAIFYIAVPVGSGMGYIVGSNIADWFQDWRFALRVTPPLGFVCILLLIFIVQEPKRGSAEGQIVDADNRDSMFHDIIYLCKNKTFMWITFGFTFASFVLGGVSWWVPVYVQNAMLSNNIKPSQIPLLFGVITVVSGLLGVSLSTIMAPKLRAKTTHADPFICAFGSFVSIPALFIIILITRTADPIVFWFIVGLAVTAMCLAWTIVADILLYVVYPNKRSIASAVNILISHLLGDAGSPYLIGAISDTLRANKPDTYLVRFESLQMALFLAPFFALLSFAAYLFAAIYIDEDRKHVDLMIKQHLKLNVSNEAIHNQSASSSSSSSNGGHSPPNTTAAQVPQQQPQPLLNQSITSQVSHPGVAGIANPLLLIASDDNINTSFRGLPQQPQQQNPPIYGLSASPPTSPQII